MQAKAPFLARPVRDILSHPDWQTILVRLGLDGSERDEQVDRWRRVAAEALGSPIAVIVLADAEQQRCEGIGGLPATAFGKVRLARSFCQHVIAAGRPVGVDDAHDPPGPRDGLPSAATDLRACAGAPIVVSGHAVGVLGVIETAPRAWTDGELKLLGHLADGLATEIELRIVVAELTRSNELIAAHNRIDELIAADRPLSSILDAITRCVETHDPSLLGSVLLFDDERQTLHDGAGPSLPSTYRSAIDGLAVGPAVGSCGTAAFNGHEVISHDLHADRRWSDFRTLIDPLGLRHCWSFPITRSDGSVLGTLAVYGTRPRSPVETDLHFLRDAAKLTGIAIERRNARDRLIHDATHDALTGLANRAVAFERLERILADEVADRAGSVAVLLISLDRLKAVNDTLGHDIGDHVVQQAARRLQRCAGPGDMVARLTGSVCVLVSAGDRDHAAALAARTLTALAVPTATLREDDITVTASIGVAIVTDPRTSARDAVRHAGSAMYAAEARGGNTYAWAAHADTDASSRRLEIENGLRHAVQRDELTVLYQPIQRYADGRVAGVEALMRWTNPKLGAVPPDEFIPIAEQSGLIHGIGAWALQTACAELPALCDQYGEELFLTVNVSAQQLRSPDLAELVADTLTRTGLAPERLWIEITETALLGFDTTTAMTVEALQAMGAKIALDDFGTGYSSLSVLKRYPVSAIKIDRSFTNGLPDDADDLAIVTALTAMAKSLGLTVIAEGIETASQHETLRTLGCDHAQGYLIGKPAPTETRQPDAR
jgi:diguanylate cyclase (GGDEF)-like protein